jgi:acetyl-CoA carboxylase biotin carboxyl carrier protein
MDVDIVCAPLAGTFYEAPQPDEPPFVRVGQAVAEGDVLCLIESMKVFVEVRAPCPGTVHRVRARNEDHVSAQQPLFEIAPAA